MSAGNEAAAGSHVGQTDPGRMKLRLVLLLLLLPVDDAVVRRDPLRRGWGGRSRRGTRALDIRLPVDLPGVARMVVVVVKTGLEVKRVGEPAWHLSKVGRRRRRRR